MQKHFIYAVLNHKGLYYSIDADGQEILSLLVFRARIGVGVRQISADPLWSFYLAFILKCAQKLWERPKLWETRLLGSIQTQIPT